MEDEKQDDGCAHAACSCPVDIGHDYCSEKCRTAAAAHEVSCACNHPDCDGPVS